MKEASTQSIWEQKLADFREATASAQPTPGGGSVAGVSASLGLGLVIMALEISGKRKDVTQPEATQALIARGRELLAQMSADADADIAAFQGYMAALKLPKTTDEEKAARTGALQGATREATQSPLRTAKRMVEALKLAGEALPLTHAHVVSDVGAGASLLGGALTAVLFNVDINLPSLQDGAQKAAWAAERGSLAEEGKSLAASVLENVGRALGSEG